MMVKNSHVILSTIPYIFIVFLMHSVGENPDIAGPTKSMLVICYQHQHTST